MLELKRDADGTLSYRHWVTLRGKFSTQYSVYSNPATGGCFVRALGIHLAQWWECEFDANENLIKDWYAVEAPPPAPDFPTDGDDSYANGVDRLPIGISDRKVWYLDIPAGSKGVLLNVVGSTLETNAKATFMFPDGRIFPASLEDQMILGPGTKSFVLRLWCQGTPSPNLPDQYMPIGRYALIIEGNVTGFMSMGF